MTLIFEAEQDEALEYFKAMRTQQLPITATAWHNKQVSIRFSESENILKKSKPNLKGDELADAGSFWKAVRDHQHSFFQENDKPLWRFSLPPSSEKFARIDNDPLVEWGGAQRWVKTNAPHNIIQSIASSRKGYVTLFKGDLPGVPHFPVLEKNLLKLHKSLKRKMDSHGIFNLNRMYQGL